MAKSRLAPALDITRKGGLMKAKAEEAKPSSKVWEEEFGKGTRNWMYVYRMMYPYLAAIRADPELTKVQRMIATQAWWHIVHEGLPFWLSKAVHRAKLMAKASAPTEVTKYEALPTSVVPV